VEQSRVRARRIKRVRHPAGDSNHK
jgi:hypothetical protein